MPIEIVITAATGDEARVEMLKLLHGAELSFKRSELADVIDRTMPTEETPMQFDGPIVDGSVQPAETPVAEAAPKRRGRPKKEEAGTENPTAGAVGSDTSSTAATNSAEGADAPPSEPLTKEKTKERLMDLVQKIGSPQALAWMHEKFGYAKFGDMPAEKYAEFAAAMDAKMAEG